MENIGRSHIQSRLLRQTRFIQAVARRYSPLSRYYIAKEAFRQLSPSRRSFVPPLHNNMLSPTHFILEEFHHPEATGTQIGDDPRVTAHLWRDLKDARDSKIGNNAQGGMDAVDGDLC